jgi:hypothetical protein
VSRSTVQDLSGESPLSTARTDVEATTSTEPFDRQLNILVPGRLHAALKARSLERGCALAELVREALVVSLQVTAPVEAAQPIIDRSRYGTTLPVNEAAKIDAQAYQHLVRVGGNLNQAMKAIHGGRGEAADWPLIREAAHAVIALKRHVTGLMPGPVVETTALPLRRETVVPAGSPVSVPPQDDGFSAVL